MARLRSRTFWVVCLFCIIATGICSRLAQTGAPLIDKYMGDALYAAMMYALVSLVRPKTEAATWAMAIMAAMELFQLTMIPARLFASDSLAVRLVARLLGTQFSLEDLVAYAVGIGLMRWTAR